jgi:DNA invertase Pin-like site-specific DNA recombinase
MPRFAAGAPYLWPVPIYGYARVSTDGQTLDAQIAQLKAAGAEKIFREKVSGARADRPELARLMRTLTSGDVVIVTRRQPAGKRSGRAEPRSSGPRVTRHLR